jgi:hypothetical protein
MVERTGGASLCEICQKRPATRTLPRGPRGECHLCVCDECNPYYNTKGVTGRLKD